ncbi:hypothetical protein Prudu_014665, partial [Prunus dulcis]
NLGILLAPLRRARRKESVDMEWGRIGVVTKKLCAKRAADFQKVLAPPPSSNGHGTGGVGTAIESPTFYNRPQPRGRPELAGKSCFPKEVRPKLPKLPARNSPSFLHQIDRALGARQDCKRDIRRVKTVEVRGIHHRANYSFRTKALGARQDCKRDLRRVKTVEVRGIHHRANYSFRTKVKIFGIGQNTGETLPKFRQKSKRNLKRI